LATGRIYRGSKGKEHIHAMHLLEQSRELFKKLKDSWGQAFALEHLGLFYDDGTRETELIDTVYEEMEKLSLVSGDRYRIAQSFSRIAGWHLDKNELDRAEQLTIKADGYYQDLGIQVMPLNYWNQMLIYYVRGKYDQAKSLFQNTDRKLEIIGNRNQRWIGFIILSLIALEENQPEVIIDLGLKARELKVVNQNKAFIADQNMILGAGYYLNGDRIPALENIKSSLDILTDLRDRKNAVIAYTLQHFSWVLNSMEPLEASRLLGVAHAYHESFSKAPFESYNRHKISKIIKSQIGEDEFDKAFTEGEKMSIHEAIEFAKSLIEKF